MFNALNGNLVLIYPDLKSDLRDDFWQKKNKIVDQLKPMIVGVQTEGKKSMSLLFLVSNVVPVAAARRALPSSVTGTFIPQYTPVFSESSIVVSRRVFIRSCRAVLYYYIFPPKKIRFGRVVGDKIKIKKL